MPERIYNFSPGPGTLPQEVLAQAAKDIVNFNDKGISLIELSHRSKEFIGVYTETEADIRELLKVPDNFKILFLQGGASSQFAFVPLNLLGGGKKGTYLNTGAWAKKAIKEANIIATSQVAYSAEESVFNHVPADADYSVDDDSEYLYFVSNNTIYGTQFKEFPKSDKMLICDMSSDIMSRTIDFSKFGLIFAGAQKNMGPAGCTIVIIRDDLLDRVPDTVPTMFRYKTHAAKDSMFNTPPCFALYCIGLVCKWLKANGGVEAMAKRNAEKAAILYDMIDSTPFYKGHAKEGSRSLMNVTFNLPTPELEAEFVKLGTEKGLDGLKGHRSIGGCRASIYNAFPKQGVIDLVDFMKEFEKANS
jgi:phosphoserine aminotransferase